MTISWSGYFSRNPLTSMCASGVCTWCWGSCRTLMHPRDISVMMPARLMRSRTLHSVRSRHWRDSRIIAGRTARNRGQCTTAASRSSLCDGPVEARSPWSPIAAFEKRYAARSPVTARRATGHEPGCAASTRGHKRYLTPVARSELDRWRWLRTSTKQPERHPLDSIEDRSIAVSTARVGLGRRSVAIDLRGVHRKGERDARWAVTHARVVRAAHPGRRRRRDRLRPPTRTRTDYRALASGNPRRRAHGRQLYHGASRTVGRRWLAAQGCGSHAQAAGTARY